VYKSFFDLKKNPFNVNPDPTYLYLTPQMRQALEELRYGIETRKGLLLLTGDTGTGKTTLLNHLLLWLSHQHARTAFIFNSHLDSSQLFDFIFSEFEIPEKPQAKTNPLLAFNEWLLARHRCRELVVLIVDEAQGLPASVLEEIRMLSNMETPEEKLLQIVLAGQPELETKLKRPDLRQLQQRIALRCKTARLTVRETHDYIEDRLHTAGSKNASIFMPEAVESIHNYSRGTPRLINLLCENALINAYVEQQPRISSAFVDEAARELQFDDLKTPRLHAITPPAGAPELSSILAKIQADAESALPDTQKSVPFLVTTRTNSEAPVARVFEHHASGLSNDAVSADLQAPRHEARAFYRKRRRNRVAKLFASNVASARGMYRRFEAHSKVLSAVEIVRGLAVQQRLHHTARKLANQVRTASAPAFTRVSAATSPGMRAGAAAAANWISAHAASLSRWSAQNFREEACGKTLVATSLASALLYLLARRMDAAQGWLHPGRLVIAFAGFLLCALSLGVGAVILVRARQQLRADSSALFANAARWLRAPIYSMEMRELLDSISEKMHSQRRA
jgi:type II secretory pathway predicted ATPase ExeA